MAKRYAVTLTRTIVQTATVTVEADSRRDAAFEAGRAPVAEDAWAPAADTARSRVSSVDEAASG